MIFGQKIFIDEERNARTEISGGRTNKSKYIYKQIYNQTDKEMKRQTDSRTDGWMD